MEFEFNPFRKIKIRSFKRKKLRTERTKKERTYKIHFTFVLQDDGKNHNIENLQIIIPASSAFDAKQRLTKHLQNKVSFNIHDMEVTYDPNEDEDLDETNS
ncbi:MAG: hypothetical protein SLAVMIC_00274 [uncultured marine phage]|uniref:Uncharacterized protein n=1 Tax=uncultured marine phage TaxID=707152 RepID=A0A8D9C9Q6_9VIRU|nr:MAG: hypothetical protein SLAVMIC_00274 [uncultured marine phage]